MKNDCVIKIIVDTNLWISFLIGKKLSCLLELISNGNIELVVSQELLDEIADVASRPKFRKYFSKEHFDMLWEFVTQETLYYKIDNISSRCRDPKDDYLLELALVSGADYLITGDRDLLTVEKVGSCQIVGTIKYFV
jgi:putative PIN family toxin of toxin-antitoxin system